MLRAKEEKVTMKEEAFKKEKDDLKKREATLKVAFQELE